MLLVVFAAHALAVDLKRGPDGSVLYAYFRSDNYDQAVNVSRAVRRVTWSTTYRIFDSLNEVSVTRYDVWSDADFDVPIGPGGGYLFTQSDRVDVLNTSFGRDSIAAVPGGGVCLSLKASPGSVLVVNSGVPGPCVLKTVPLRVGTTELHNNAVDYVPNGTCARPIRGGGGAADYDNLDGPVIPPLASHFHTRGAIYYTVNGSATFDDGVDPAKSGELRFVNAGYFYGPETFDNGTRVISIHEPDPAWIVFDDNHHAADDYFQPCPIACLDEPPADAAPATLIRCVNPTR